MIKIDQATLSFGSQTIFNKINLAIQTDQKIGLFGPNGAGKSSLLKILARQQTFDSGNISIPGKMLIAYLPQELAVNSTKNILAEALTVFDGFINWEKTKQLELMLQQDPHNQSLLANYAHEIALVHELRFEQ